VIEILLFDRDGVLNSLVQEPLGTLRAPRNRAEVNFFKDAERFILENRNKYRMGIISNQPDVARGQMSFSEMTEVHYFISNHFKIRESWICIHSDNECNCRKPKTGLLEHAAIHYKVTPDEILFIGDRWTDILAGKRFGTKTAFLTRSLENSISPTSAGDLMPSTLEPDIYVSNFQELKVIN
jgi:D-glycero-D-manno-heptose 1,7-bisphosphate phosphatase